MSGDDGRRLRRIEAFLYHEAQLLDERKFEEWLALFTASCWYWVPISAEQDSPLDMVSIIYDDRKLLETRIRRLMHPEIHAQSPPSRTSRIIANITLEDPGSGEETVIVTSRIQMVEFRGGEQRLYAGGVRHGLVEEGDRCQIAWKRVDLVDSGGMIEGITIPF
jgi:benzoate/toluate 1,2-dioxygenase beta subunit